MAVQFLKLTAPDGSPVWVFDAWIQSVRRPIGGPETAKTELVLSGERQFVVEAPDEVITKLNGLYYRGGGPR